MRIRRVPRKLNAERCYGCRKRLHHAGPKAWRAFGGSVAIRCLDCRLAFCPRCARKHFAPVQTKRAKVMSVIVDAAIKAMRHKCKEARP